MWCERVPVLDGLVPERPTKQQAKEALLVIRRTFKTFCFADAKTINENGVTVVDLKQPPGRDESAFLNALLTAVSRPSLYLAPGFIFRAPALSGAGSGKGLLARCVCQIAFGRQPHAVTQGTGDEELEKRIAAELIEGNPVLFLDNLNGHVLKSETLASAITERPSRVRVFRQLKMVPLNAVAFAILTGNGLTVSEDNVRRFITADFDAHTEDPESRNFKTDIRAEVAERRTELLAAALTIWRWGRQATDITPGLALGSFEQWCAWVRDPLLALGCQYPVARLSEVKRRDTRRQLIGELFALWWKRHQGKAMTVHDLDYDIKKLADPQRQGAPVSSRLLPKPHRHAHGRFHAHPARSGRRMESGDLCVEAHRYLHNRGIAVLRHIEVTLRSDWARIMG